MPSWKARGNRFGRTCFAIAVSSGLDHYAIFMENKQPLTLETCGAGERSGLYFTCCEFVPDRE